MKNFHYGASVVEVTDQTVATDLHELIYRSTTSVNTFDGSRYAVSTSNLKTRDEYKSELRELFVTGQKNDFEDLEG